MNTIIIFCAQYLIFVAIGYVAARSLQGKHKIEHVLISLCTALLAWVVAHFLKGIIAHPRPDSMHALIVPDDMYSFPSGHATFMSALAVSMYSFNKKTGYVIFTLAIITGMARVLAGVHFWYDILGGVCIGALVGYLCVTVYTSFFKKII
jgi:undecaprenyl-diphosphatase